MLHWMLDTQRFLCMVQPVPLPKDTPSSASPLTLEVQHKPGSKNFSYKELRGESNQLRKSELTVGLSRCEHKSVLVTLVCPVKFRQSG